MSRGSHATFAGWEPKRCCVCGGKIVLTGKEALCFYYDDRKREGWSWHVSCGRKETPEPLKT